VSDDTEEETKQRTFTALLNKLTLENFDRIVVKMREINVRNAAVCLMGAGNAHLPHRRTRL
jgi:hypothetical protein